MRKYFWVIVLCLVSGYTGYAVGQQRLRFAFRNWKPVVSVNQQFPPTQKETDFSLFWQVWDKLASKYVDKTVVVPQKMVDGAISGMVASLGDPYTVYLPPQQNKEAKADLGGTFEGVGIQLGFKGKQLSVVAPLQDTPAWKAGVRAGDLITHIADAKKGVDRDTIGITLPEAVNLIRGPKGSMVELTLVREGAREPTKVNLKRENILVKSVTVDFKGDVAIIKLSRFGDRTQEEWNQAVAEIKNQNAKIKSIVLDLRDNPGGYLDGAVFMAGEFLPAGKLVVSQQSGDGSKIDSKVDRNGQLLKEKLVVLVNKGSASAAEILAGALRDWNRAKIVGETTFGKGSVQQPEDFSNGSGVHITIAKWLRPNGEWIDKVGIKPDYEVKGAEPVDGESIKPENDPQLQKAVELL